MAEAWSDDELSACLLAYLEMLGKQEADIAFSKADYRRALLADALVDRTHGSIEYRMQNISAYFADRDMPTVNGYLPAKNVGRGVLERLQRLLDELGEVEATDFSPTNTDDRLNDRVARLSRVKRPYLPVGNKQPQRTTSSQDRFIRDPAVIDAVLNLADGRCELCNEPAPFHREDGSPYLEVHHVRFLAEGGPDTVYNAVAVCPNCHRACHHSAERAIIRSKLVNSIQRLKTD